MNTDKFYTVKSLANKLDVKPLTVYRLIKQGKIQAVKIGRAIRFDPTDVETFLQSVRLGPEK